MRKLEIAFVGLGKMGGNMARRLIPNGVRVLGYDMSEETLDTLSKSGLVPANSLNEVPALFQSSPRVIWMMVPAGAPVDSVINSLSPQLAAGDILIDGGNTRYSDTVSREKKLREMGIHYLDIGTSGGIGGLENGYCLMVGGEREAFEYVEPILKLLAPAEGYLHVGASGSGHYAKMVHNGIEYGVMQALAEGFDLLHHAPYDIDLRAMAALWNRGSVLRSWLVELLEDAFSEEKNLDSIIGYVEDSGEGRWTVEEAISRAVPTPVIAASLFSRFRSRRDNSFGDRVLAALRKQFGGHAVRTRS